MSHPEPTPVTPRREANKAQKRSRIRDAALALWREKGIDATTTREVAERAEIAAGTLFLYVRDKDDLVHFVFRDEVARIVDERFASLPARAQITGRLVHVFAGLLEFYAADLEITRRLLREVMIPTPGHDTLSFTIDFIARVVREIQGALDRSEMPDSRRGAERLATDVFALYVGAVLGVSQGMPVSLAIDDLRDAIAHHLRVERPTTHHRKPKTRTKRKRS